MKIKTDSAVESLQAKAMKQVLIFDKGKRVYVKTFHANNPDSFTLKQTPQIRIHGSMGRGSEHPQFIMILLGAARLEHLFSQPLTYLRVKSVEVTKALLLFF